MPDTLPPLSINIQAVTTALESGLAKANAEVTAFANQTVAKLDAAGAKTEGLATAFNHLRYAIGAALAAGGAIFGLKALDEQASRVRTALDEAANSVRNLGGALDIERVRSFTYALATGMAAGVASTTELFDSVQTLGTHVTNTTQLERAMNDAVQLAAATHESYGEAVNQVARGLAGYITILVHAGLITKDESKNIHTVEQAMELLAQKTKNSTDAIDPNEKAWGRLQNTFKNIEIEVGQGMAPAILKAVDAVNQWLGSLNNLVPDLQAATVVAVNFFRTVRDGIRSVWDLGASFEHLAAGLFHVGMAMDDFITRNFRGVIDQGRAAVDQFKALGNTWNDQASKMLSYADIFGKVSTGKITGAPAGSSGSPDFAGGVGKPTGSGSGIKTFTRPTETIRPDLPAAFYDHIKSLMDLMGGTIGGKFAAIKDPAPAFTAAMLPLEQQLEAIRTQGALEKARGTDTPEKAAQRAQATAEAQAKLADLAVAAADAKKTFDSLNRGDTQADEAALNKALVDQTKAQDDLKVATAALNKAFQQAHVTFQGIENKLQETVGTVIPGIFGTAAQRVTSFSDFLAQSLQKSPAWLDIQNVMAHVMYAVAQIFTALRPVIDLFLKILVGVVNGFLSIWNIIAKILSLFGIHVAQLQLITDAFSSLTAPLIRIVHDIPTLNELATNNIAPLHPSQYYDQISNQLQPAMQAQTSLLKEIGAVLTAGLALWIISNALHLLHIGATAVQTSIMTAGDVGIIGQLTLANALLLGILTKPSFAGFTFCPGVDQIMETREHGFIRAGDLKAGMHLRADDGCEWHELYSVEIKPTMLVRSHNEFEPLEVNWDHSFRDKAGEWRLARELEPGDELLKANFYGGGTVKIVDTIVLGPGEYAALNCEHHEYIIGRTIGHNDSGGFLQMMRDVHDATRRGGIGGGSSTVHSPISMHAHFYGDMHGISDIEEAGKGLAEGAARAQRNRAYLVDRVNS